MNTSKTNESSGLQGAGALAVQPGNDTSWVKVEGRGASACYPPLDKTAQAVALLVDMSERIHQIDGRTSRIEEMLQATSEADEKWWTPAEIARKVDRADLTVREWARLDKIPSKKDSRGRRWIASDVAELIFRYQGLPPEEALSSLSKPKTVANQSVALCSSS